MNSAIDAGYGLDVKCRHAEQPAKLRLLPDLARFPS
jgi:hypothetical protein